MTRCVLETFQPTWRRTGFYRSFRVSTPPHPSLTAPSRFPHYSSSQCSDWPEAKSHSTASCSSKWFQEKKRIKAKETWISVPHCFVRLVREWTLVSCKPFTVLLADEFNRVIIPVKRGEENTDYVNASFIDVSDGYVPWVCPMGLLVPHHIPAWEKHL